MKRLINRNLLKAEIAKNGLTQKSVAKELGMSEQVFTRRLKKGVFGTDEAEKMIDLLQIDNPAQVFFNR